MAPRKADDCHINKRIAAAGCRLPTILPAGEILTDITKKEWILGSRLGSGGFGDIYLASDDTTKPVGQNAKYVIKIEPHENGPLFVEMNFYIRSARQHMIKNWCDSQRKTRIGIPTYEGSGSHVYQKERFRFLVIPRYGIDVGKIFESRGRKLSTKFVNSLAIQMLDALEYIHSRGYAHSDVKGSNIILDIDQQKTTNPRANLVDYGLAYRFKTSVGLHKPFVHDERRAHEGTLEFTSRDAHHGTHSRRGDIETLGYNILQWMCGKLPWEQKNGGMAPSSNPDDIHMKKEHYLSDISLLMKECFLEQKKKPPLSIIEYFKHIVSLNFESKPNYNYLRNLFTRNGKIEKTFMTRKRVADENIIYPMPIKKPNLRDRTTKLNLQLKDRKPCKPLNIEGRVTRTQTIDETEKFCWEEVLAGHPDKLAKISAQPIYTDVDTLTPPPSPPPSQSPSFSSSTTPSRPTYAMVQIIKKIKERQTNGYKPKSKSYEDSKPKWMTPAMEEISRLKKKLQTIPTTKKITFSPRLTRSRVANNNKIKKKSISNNKGK